MTTSSSSDEVDVGGNDFDGDGRAVAAVVVVVVDDDDAVADDDNAAPVPPPPPPDEDKRRAIMTPSLISGKSVYFLFFFVCLFSPLSVRYRWTTRIQDGIDAVQQQKKYGNSINNIFGSY